MISTKYKCVFIHIPRTGGCSIEECFNNTISRDNPHHPLLIDIQQNRKYKKYFTFVFVRNPWDRLVSWFLWSHMDIVYYQWKSEKGEFYATTNPERAWEKGKVIVQEKNTLLNQKFFLKFKNAFAVFVESLTPEDLIYNSSTDDYRKRYNRLKSKWIMPQVEWIKNEKGKIEIDFIGKYENLQKDVNRLFKKLKLPKASLPYRGVIASRPPYARFYTKKTQKIIEDLYAEDIKKFKYKF